ncbi:CDK5 regulatory subunit-associated protein 3-like [Paramacrobiotus metropolitanus]|uniref:CDK5 regulatory subunit-associated protein 3-like n=1 Tax=Paramacrobiotus metropolitanus TaxID=2943436 RepID=UPI00244627AE|nr:CDK5 regulatory subunit-associated protein 3-like [Paramacrobiotus metropolitanus]
MASDSSRHIPIDIHLGQLLEWLISRRHCTRDWHASLTAVREKLASLFPKLQEDGNIQSILSTAELPTTASDLLYVHCKKIFELLNESPLGAKNLLGQYQSPLMKDLNEVMKLYEKDNTYLAELGQVIYRNITYDIPFIKKQMHKLDQSVTEYGKKSEDAARNAAEFHDQYRKECEVLGIEGRNVMEELLLGAKVLPQMYDSISSRSVILQPLCKNVEEFIAAIHKGSTKEEQTGSDLFPLVHHLMKYGNQPYPLTEQPHLEDTVANIAVMDTALPAVTEEDRESSRFSLDVNLNDTIADHLNELNKSDVADVIDFNIEEPEGDNEVDWDLGNDDISITVEDSCDFAKRSVLDNPETRIQMTNELHELLAFLQRRLEEQTTEHMASSFLNLQTLADSVLFGDKRTVQQHIGSVQEILDLLNDHRLQSLCKLHDSTTFLERLTKQLEHKLTLARRMEDRAESFKIHRLEAAEERKKLDPELQQLITGTREVQKFIEQEISRKYHDRRVTILGGIQAVT